MSDAAVYVYGIKYGPSGPTVCIDKTVQLHKIPKGKKKKKDREKDV